MQEDQYAEYREYLGEGIRIEVGIPLAGGGIFRDWAVIRESAGDELLAQISRDVLPANVRVDEGFILDVSIWIKKDVYTCSGIVIEKLAEGRELRIRLFGDFTLRERRQFFRSYMSLRLRYAFVEEGQRHDVQGDWERRKDLEHMKFQGYDDFVIAGQMARYAPAVKLDWRDVRAAEVNLGGGGICFSLPVKMKPEQLLALEIHLPLSPPRQVHAIAQVIHVTGARFQKGVEVFQTGMQFTLLDERDRDLIFRHISVTQLAYLRMSADKRDLDVSGEGGSEERDRSVGVVRRVVWTAVFVLVVGYVVWYLIQYQKEGPPNEIQKTYENAIKQYRHQE